MTIEYEVYRFIKINLKRITFLLWKIKNKLWKLLKTNGLPKYLYIYVILIYLIFMNLYVSYSIVIMTQNYYEHIISGHNNYVSWYGNYIDTIKVNIEVRTSSFQQLSSYIREKSGFLEYFKWKRIKNLRKCPKKENEVPIFVAVKT